MTTDPREAKARELAIELTVPGCSKSIHWTHMNAARIQAEQSVRIEHYQRCEECHARVEHLVPRLAPRIAPEPSEDAHAVAHLVLDLIDEKKMHYDEAVGEAAQRIEAYANAATQFGYDSGHYDGINEGERRERERLRGAVGPYYEAEGYCDNAQEDSTTGLCDGGSCVYCRTYVILFQSERADGGKDE